MRVAKQLDGKASAEAYKLNIAVHIPQKMTDKLIAAKCQKIRERSSKRDISAICQTGRRRDHSLLGNAGVEEAVGKSGLKTV